MIPEQDWEDPGVPASPYGSDPTTASIGFTDGKGTGSAGEITWAEAQFVRLTRDIGTGTLIDQPSIVRNRYVTRGAPTKAPLTITAPARRRDRHYAHHDRDGDGRTGGEGGHRLDAVTRRRHRRGRHSALRPGAHQHH